MVIKSVYAKDFMSLAEARLDFQTMEPYLLVLGENRDSEGASSNGSGKSSLFQSIVWGIFGNTLELPSADDVIRRQAERAEVTLNLADDKHDILIHRVRDTRGMSLTVEVDGQDVTDRVMSMTQGNLLYRLGFVESSIADALVDFTNVCGFTSTSAKFFTSRGVTNKDRMALISRLLQLEVLDKCMDVARERNRNFKSAMETSHGALQVLEERVGNYTHASVKKRLSEIVTEREIHNKTIEAQKEMLTEVLRYETWQQEGKRVEALSDATSTVPLDQLGERFEVISEKRDALEETLGSGTIVDVSAFEKEAEEINSLLVQTKVALANSADTIRSLEQGDPHTCPSCNEPILLLNSELFTLGQKEETVSKAKEEEARLIVARDNYEEEKTRAVTTLTETKTLNDGISDLQRQITAIDTEMDDIDTRGKSLAAEIEKSKGVYLAALAKWEEEKKTFNSEELTSSRQDIERVSQTAQGLISKLALEEQSLTSLSKDIDRLGEEKVKQTEIEDGMAKVQFWVSSFPKMRAWMIEGFLPEFESRVNSFLDSMGVSERVRMSTVSDSTSGERLSFSIEVWDGSLWCSFESLSQGESKRLLLCIGLALRECSLDRKRLSFDFLLFDEILDGLDPEGIERFLTLLPSLGGQAFVISHEPSLHSLMKDGDGWSVLRASKEGGVSTIRMET